MKNADMTNFRAVSLLEEPIALKETTVSTCQRRRWRKGYPTVGLTTEDVPGRPRPALDRFALTLAGSLS